MFKICEKHCDCIVVHDQILGCPICNELAEKDKEILRIEACLNEYEDKKPIERKDT